MKSPESQEEYTLWVVSYGPQPRRVLVYLREKKIPAHLAKINIVDCTLDRAAYKFVNTEGKPANSSFPVLKIHKKTDNRDGRGYDDAYLMHSISILEYFEDRFPQVPRNMRGDNALERGRVRDVVAAEADVFAWLCAHAMFGSALKANRFTMSESASRDALRVVFRDLGRLEALVRQAVLRDDDHQNWLAGTGEPSLADCVVAADFDTYSRFYGVNYATAFPEKYPALARWFARFQARGSLMGMHQNERPPQEYVQLGEQFVFDRSTALPEP